MEKQLEKNYLIFGKAEKPGKKELFLFNQKEKGKRGILKKIFDCTICIIEIA